MPNHCNNSLKLSSDNFNNLHDFYTENKSIITHDDKDEEILDLCFNKSVTRPSDEESNWYDWNYFNWGTKWNAYEINYSEYKENKIIIYDFQTAWGPPNNWLEKVYKKYPNIIFELEYSEEGSDFGGYIKYNDGDLEVILEYTLSEYNWDKVDKELLEKIIDEYINSSDYDSSEDIEDMVEVIHENYSDQDTYYSNIHNYIENEINRIKENVLIEPINLEYNDIGNTVYNFIL